MAYNDIRRSQLIAPFGVGALSVQIDGTSTITAGLDFWFDSEFQNRQIDEREFVRNDWRLQQRLGVSEFRLPPDFRALGNKDAGYNSNLRIPVLRFPLWVFCPFCKRLEKTKSAQKAAPKCHNPKHSEGKDKFEPRMSQVPFVTFCDKGHLMDFPFDEWVHRGGKCKYQSKHQLFLISKGNGLDNQIVRCGEEKNGKSLNGCGAKRSLQGVTTRKANGDTHLSDSLNPEEYFGCKGDMPWLGLFDQNGSCGLPVRATLRGAGNLYFAKVESSILIPKHKAGISAELLNTLENVNSWTRIESVLQFDDISNLDNDDYVRKLVANGFTEKIAQKYRPDEWREAILYKFENSNSEDGEVSSDEYLQAEDFWRYPEYCHLREISDFPELRTSDPGVPEQFSGLISRVRGVHVLEETRVLRGFTRGFASPLSLSDGKAQLRRAGHEHSDWLPAAFVRGEGIYIEFDLDVLNQWEMQDSVRKRIEVLDANVQKFHEKFGTEPASVSARYVMLHTFSHLLINQLVFECGYNSASLRERLYVSSEDGREMAGILVYTAAGDSEGTLGGLVQMANKTILGSVITNALEDANWCSGDPVCMELGDAGQGPDSTNLAACHNCALLPETACESFNRLLDRGLLVGKFGQDDFAFFK